MHCSARPYEGNEPYIFVSYAHSSAATVYPLIERLVRDGYRVWYDEGLHPGDNWLRVIAQHLDRSAVVLAPITPAFCGSYNCYSEVNLALNLRKPVISVVMEDFQLPLESQLLLGPSHMLRRSDFPNGEAFLRKLYSAPVLSECKSHLGSHYPGPNDGTGTTVVVTTGTPDPYPVTAMSSSPALVDLNAWRLLTVGDVMAIGDGMLVAGDKLVAGTGMQLDGHPLRSGEQVRLGFRSLIQVGQQLYFYCSGSEAKQLRESRMLHLLFGEGSGDLLILSADRDQVLGRGCSLTVGILSDRAVSSTHARIRLKGPMASVMDLRSTNGTFLDGKRLPQGVDVTLPPGSRLRLGDTVFRYEICDLH